MKPVKHTGRTTTDQKSAWVDGAVCALSLIDRTYSLSNLALEELQKFFGI